MHVPHKTENTAIDLEMPDKAVTKALNTEMQDAPDAIELPRVRGEIVPAHAGRDAGRSTGPAHVDRKDARMRMDAPEEGRVEHAGHHHVADVPPPPGEQPLVLHAADGGADEAHPVSTRRGSGRPSPWPPASHTT